LLRYVQAAESEITRFRFLSQLVTLANTPGKQFFCGMFLQQGGYRKVQIKIGTITVREEVGSAMKRENS